MMTYIEILQLELIMIFLLGLSGSVHNLIYPLIQRMLRTHRSIEIKLLECELCYSFWTGIIYLLVTQQFTITMMLYVCLISYMAPIFKDILWMIKELIIRFLNLIKL